MAASRWIEGAIAQALARSSQPAGARKAEIAPALPALPLRSMPSPRDPEPKEGDVVGRLRIPRVGMDLAVFEGVGENILWKGPGHVPGTALPTAGSNCVISAHRDSFFRKLADVRAGDAVFLSGENGEREYRLASRRVVSPRETEVMDPTDTEQVTLVTCYPFRWIGPAPQRVVWTAVPVQSTAARGPSAGSDVGLP
jgi:sortase A